MHLTFFPHYLFLSPSSLSSVPVLPSFWVGKTSQICSLCGKQFTFASLVQHEKRCVTNWEREQAELPTSMRAKRRPALASEQMRKAQAMVEQDMQRFEH
jgi:hypothetical protein